MNSLKEYSKFEAERQKESIINYECLDRNKIDIVEFKSFFSSSRDVIIKQIKTLLVNGSSKEALITLFNVYEQLNKNHIKFTIVKCPNMSDYGQFYFAVTVYHPAFGDNEFSIHIYNSALMQIDSFQLSETDI